MTYRLVDRKLIKLVRFFSILSSSPVSFYVDSAAEPKSGDGVVFFMNSTLTPRLDNDVGWVT
jgi:hypothetical protein